MEKTSWKERGNISTLSLWLSLFQVSGGHADVSALQQGLDQGEDLRAAPSSGPAGVQVKRPLRNMEKFFSLFLLPVRVFQPFTYYLGGWVVFIDNLYFWWRGEECLNALLSIKFSFQKLVCKFLLMFIFSHCFTLWKIENMFSFLFLTLAVGIFPLLWCTLHTYL